MNQRWHIPSMKLQGALVSGEIHSVSDRMEEASGTESWTETSYQSGYH